MHENYVPQEQANAQNAAATTTTSQVRTGADVIAACMAAPAVRPQGSSTSTPAQPPQGAGTTGPQAQMEYGADPGYGA